MIVNCEIIILLQIANHNLEYYIIHFLLQKARNTLFRLRTDRNRLYPLYNRRTSAIRISGSCFWILLDGNKIWRNVIPRTPITIIIFSVRLSNISGQAATDPDQDYWEVEYQWEMKKLKCSDDGYPFWTRDLTGSTSTDYFVRPYDRSDFSEHLVFVTFR